MNSIQYSEILHLAKQQGLRAVGTTRANLASIDQVGKALSDWQQRGYAGQMRYMQRPVDLLGRPEQILPEVKSILVFSVNYASGLVPQPLPGYGRIARYAWGRDYHKVLKRKLRAFVSDVEESIGAPVNYRVFSDAVPLLERSLALQAGLGFVGKNTMLIRPRVGSFFFLAEVLWDLEVTGHQPAVLETSCGTCCRCRGDCPTDALVEDRVMDARRCISYLTIEKRGALEPWEREALGLWVFGCDICQESCPFNHTAQKLAAPPDLAEFSSDSGYWRYLPGAKASWRSYQALRAGRKKWSEGWLRK